MDEESRETRRITSMVGTMTNLTVGIGSLLSSGVMLVFGLIGRQVGGRPHLKLVWMFAGVFLVSLTIDWLARLKRPAEPVDRTMKHWLQRPRTIPGARKRFPIGFVVKLTAFFLAAAMLVAGILTVAGDSETGNIISNFTGELGFIFGASLLIALAVTTYRRE